MWKIVVAADYDRSGFAPIKYRPWRGFTEAPEIIQAEGLYLDGGQVFLIRF